LLGEILTSNEEFYIPCSRVLEKEARRDFYKSINDPLVKLVFKCQYIGESIRGILEKTIETINNMI